MTVRELIRELAQYDKDTQVMFRYPSGDFWKTELAGSIDKVVQMDVKRSQYHNNMQVVEDDSGEDDPGEDEDLLRQEATELVILLG